MLEVVEHEEERVLAEQVVEADRGDITAGLSSTQRLQDGRLNIRRADAGQLDEGNAIRKGLRQLLRQAVGEACLANAAGAGQGEEPHLRPHQRLQGRQLVLAADEWRALRWQAR